MNQRHASVSCDPESQEACNRLWCHPGSRGLQSAGFYPTSLLASTRGSVSSPSCAVLQHSGRGALAGYPLQKERATYLSRACLDARASPTAKPVCSQWQPYFYVRMELMWSDSVLCRCEKASVTVTDLVSWSRAVPSPGTV